MARSVSTSGTSGFDVLRRRLEALSEEVATKAGQSTVRKVMKQVAEPALKSAAPVGPRADGTKMGRRTHTKIKTGIKVRKGRSNGENTVTALVTTGKAFHAIFTELGTVHQDAQEWAQNAIEGVTDQIITTLGTELGKAIDRAARR